MLTIETHANRKPKPLSEYSSTSRLIARYFSVGAIEAALDETRNASRKDDFSTLSDAMALRTGLFRLEVANADR